MRLFKTGCYAAFKRVPALLGGHIAPTFDLAVGGGAAIVERTKIVFTAYPDSNDGVVGLKDLSVLKVYNSIAGTFVGHFFKATQFFLQ